jgi:arabinose-5-phosphate isomerase
MNRHQQMPSILKSASERVEHFQYALSFYKKFLEEDSLFQKNFLQLLDEIVLTERSDSQASCKQVFLIAIGKSAGVARIATSMFVSVGLPVQFVHPTEAFHGDFGVVTRGDVVVFVSNNGNSSELLQLIPGLRDREAVIYAITAKPDSPLARAAQFVLQMPPVEEKCPLYQSPITSTLTSLALFQLLVAASVEKRDFSIEKYAKNHPGGSIGKRIFLKVDDLMSMGDQLPTIEPLANFQQVISKFTSCAKASLLVIKDDTLMGLIAERDLRKAMEKFGEAVFQKTAQDLMNSQPKCISSGTLAIDALQMMTAKKPYFNVLPVVNSSGVAIGLLQLQDLVGLGF